MSQSRTIIVGGGIAGAATAWWLARHGARGVVLLEGESGLGRHSTGLNAAILRTAIRAEPTCRLARETATWLAQPPADFCEVPLLDPCGLVMFTGTSGDPAPAWAPRFESEGWARPLDSDEVRRLAPHFHPRGTRAWLFPGEGRLDISAMLDGFVRGARRGGVEVRTDARVESLLGEGNEIRGVRLVGGEVVPADRVALAAGGWVQTLAATVGARAPLRPTRRHLMVTAPDSRVDPAWPVVWDDRAEFYARPESGGLLLSACDITDLRGGEVSPDPEVRALIAGKTATHLPDFADARAAHFWAGVRTLTPDDVPVLGPDPTMTGLHWIAGLAGHGMCTGYAVGRLAADFLLDRPVEPDLARSVKLDRFLASPSPPQDRSPLT